MRTCGPSTATGCRWSSSTGASTPTSRSTSRGCAGTSAPADPAERVVPGVSSATPCTVHLRGRRRRLCSCVHKRLPWRCRAFGARAVEVSRTPPVIRRVAFGPSWSLLVSESRPRIIPEATVARLAVYLRVLAGLAGDGRGHVSSGELASAAGVNPAGLRKDLSYLGPCGVRGVGYSVAGLRDRLNDVLGGERSRTCVLVGIGRLGAALADYTGFASRGFRFVGLLDADPRRVGDRVGGCTVRPIADLEDVVAD